MGHVRNYTMGRCHWRYKMRDGPPMSCTTDGLGRSLWDQRKTRRWRSVATTERLDQRQTICRTCAARMKPRGACRCDCLREFCDLRVRNINGPATTLFLDFSGRGAGYRKKCYRELGNPIRHDRACQTNRSSRARPGVPARLVEARELTQCSFKISDHFRRTCWRRWTH